MRARSKRWPAAIFLAGALCAFLWAADAARAQSDNPLRGVRNGRAIPTKPVGKKTSQATPVVQPTAFEEPAGQSAIRRVTAPKAKRRFTEYDVWGDKSPSNAIAGVNPLRQAGFTAESSAADARTPEQAIRDAEWPTIGPQGRVPGSVPTEYGDSYGDPWHDTFGHGWFVHSDPNDPHRAIGWGEPLVGTSWRNRPWYFGAFIGAIFNGDLIEGHVRQNNTALGGARLGFDFDHYWGIEARFGYANPYITEPDGTPLGVSRNYLADVELLYYPWGDSRWRPYAAVGLGSATYRFTDDQGHVIHESLLSLPIGVGVKYFYSPWFTLRFDLVDNIAFGSHTIDSQANFSLMAGAEFRFGGRRPSYFPWHGNSVGW